MCMGIKNKIGEAFKTITSLFPFQLLIAHIKYNLLSLLYWVLLFGIVLDVIASNFGIPLLFFSPEYLGEISNWSFLLLGFSIGGFTMGFNTYSYIRLAPSFSFLATLSRPFYKFCINNALIPFAFNVIFIVQFSRFQYNEEFATAGTIFQYVLAYLVGYSLFLLFSFVYFFRMNARSARSILDLSQEIDEEKVVKTIIPTREKKKHYIHNERTYLYLGKGFKFYSSRSGQHYKKEVLNKIYQKNKVNATLFETVALLSFVGLGLFRGYTYFEIPAAVSIILLLTIVLMLFSALVSWLQKWAYPVMILIFVTMNVLSIHTPFFNYKNYAYGISYKPDTRPEYSIKSIEKSSNADYYKQTTKSNILKILENWKKKTGLKKPKMILLNVSGGGSRSAMWVVNVLQNLDKEFDHQVSRHTHLISGASGGMIGAAYYREIHLQNQMGKLDNPFDPVYADNIGKDVLNSLAFALCVNDLFFRYQKTTIDGAEYTIDRAYAFEKQLHDNTNDLLNVNLKYYQKHERLANVPMMIFSPTIVNDGRRLLIASQPLNFLTQSEGGPSRANNSFENIDYLSYFKNSNPSSIRFSSVMRASATFPFVLPMVTLPTKPEVQLMDAGLRDNYGAKISFEYMHVLKEWITNNTSGVILIQIRDTKKVLENDEYAPVSLFKKFTLPFGNMYSNFPKTQDFDQEQLMKIGANEFDFPVDLISFNLRENKKDLISLSWHLTSQEKKKIKEAFNSRDNQHAVSQLRRALNQPVIEP